MIHFAAVCLYRYAITAELDDTDNLNSNMSNRVTVSGDTLFSTDNVLLNGSCPCSTQSTLDTVALTLRYDARSKC